MNISTAAIGASAALATPLEFLKQDTIQEELLCC